MSNWLLLALWVAVMLLNAVDSAMTRMGVRKGHPELNAIIRALTKELGLDRAMLIKALLPTVFVVPVVLSWNDPVIASAAIILFLVIIVLYIGVLLHNSRQLLRPQSAK